jgi:hypothetical protein
MTTPSFQRALRRAQAPEGERAGRARTLADARDLCHAPSIHAVTPEAKTALPLVAPPLDPLIVDAFAAALDAGIPGCASAQPIHNGTMAEGAGLDQHRIGKRNDPLDVDSKTIVVLKNPRDDTLEDRLRPTNALPSRSRIRVPRPGLVDASRRADPSAAESLTARVNLMQAAPHGDRRRPPGGQRSARSTGRPGTPFDLPRVSSEVVSGLRFGGTLLVKRERIIKTAPQSFDETERRRQSAREQPGRGRAQPPEVPAATDAWSPTAALSAGDQCRICVCPEKRAPCVHRATARGECYGMLSVADDGFGAHEEFA